MKKKILKEINEIIHFLEYEVILEDEGYIYDYIMPKVLKIKELVLKKFDREEKKVKQN